LHIAVEEADGGEEAKDAAKAAIKWLGMNEQRGRESRAAGVKGQRGGGGSLY
jgi:hypothetical protein